MRFTLTSFPPHSRSMTNFVKPRAGKGSLTMGGVAAGDPSPSSIGMKPMSIASRPRKRLPTEAEYEKAARTGGINEAQPTPMGITPGMAPIAAEEPHPWQASNGYGLYNMLGNVLEWCSDWYGSEITSKASRDPQGPDSGTTRVLRGGSWNESSAPRTTSRFNGGPRYGRRCGFPVYQDALVGIFSRRKFIFQLKCGRCAWNGWCGFGDGRRR